MTDIQQAEGSAVCFFGLIIVCFLGFMALASPESHRYIQGVVVIDDNYVHYLLNNSRGKLRYRIGSNSTQPQV